MSRECMVFYSGPDEFGPWKEAIEAELPDLDVRQADDISEPANVRYALVWKPPQHFFAAYPNLRLVTNLGAGVDSLVGRTDLPDIPITRLSDPMMARMMAGFVLFAVLRHARDIPVFERAQREGRWHYIHPTSPEDIRVGIMGLGELGSAAAQECARQGFAVTGWSRTPKNVAGVTCMAGPDALPAFLANTDILVCMLPATAQTNGLLDAAHLALLPEGAKFVNVSRGSVVDEAALVEALRTRRIADATLDVFATEPLPPDSPLWTLDNVLITPHLASVALPRSAARQIADNVRRVRSSQPVESRVDPARGY
ncbi:2-hydroxyacid dehydrogenase [Terrihabitans sp. B22-R8]|uniref:2-hydroxyacid dehydrogenase n=1 Tax=Terrihabitans sp. B22-R8 TaxID=3425128 RepID=UPI00403CF1D8